MKRLLPLFLFSGALVSGADLAEVRSVYLMPMPRGLDQYLASRLTSEHIFHVVTDPKLADAIFTDRIGEGFMLQLETISPTPKPPQPEAKPDPDKEDKPAAKSRRERTDKPADTSVVSALGGNTDNKTENPALNSTFGRGKGTVFLVDSKTRLVVWSTFDPSKVGSDNRDLDRTAFDIVSRLRKDLNPELKKK
jgi:hypothetical protein